MELILLERVQNLGDVGDLVSVRAGYARNYLIPQGKATVATEENKAKVEQRRQELEEAEKTRLESAKQRAGLLEGKSIVIAKKVSEEGTLFGSVSPMDIVEEVNGQIESVDLAKSEIDLTDGPIKTLGDHEIAVALHPEVHLKVTVQVVAED